MGNIFNEDFQDFIQSLNDYDVRYILVGGYSVILHGYQRTTGDMDVWIDRTAENYDKLKLAFLSFGMPVFDMTKENFLNHAEWDLFRFGKPPVSIDVMVKVKGLDFEECYNNAVIFEENGVQIKTIHLTNLVAAKKAAGRAKDINDLENLIP